MSQSNPFAASHDSDDEDGWTTEKVVQKRKEVNQASLESSRRSKQKAQETEAIAAQTLENLAIQGDQLRHAGHSMTNVHRNAESADYQAKELKRLKRFIPWTMSKDKNARKEAVRQEQKRVANIHHDHETQMRQARRAQSPHGMPPGSQPPGSHRSREQERGPHRSDSRGSSHSHRSSSHSGGGERRVRPSRAHLSTSDDELETELHNNVSAIGNAVRNLNMAAQVMSKELHLQKETIHALRSNTETAGEKIATVNTKIKKFG